MLSHAPEQEVDTYMANNLEGIKGLENVKEYERYYCQAAKKLGLNEPQFYFEITTFVSPDTLYKICYLPQQNLAVDILNKTGKWHLVQNYFNDINQALELAIALEKNTNQTQNKLVQEIFRCKSSIDVSDLIRNYIHRHDSSDALRKRLLLIDQTQESFKTSGPDTRLLLPKLKWNGVNCRFHKVLTNLFSPQNNLSLIDSRPVWKKIREALGFTLMINLLALLISILVSIKLGLWLSLVLKSKKEKIISGILFVLYTLPAFWVGALCLIYLTSSGYGKIFNIFPAGGVGDVSGDDNIFKIMIIRLYHFALPVICISYPVIAYLTTHLRDGIAETAKSQFMTTALSKGLIKRDALKKHVLKNAVFPFISLLGNVVPSIFAGSLIVEVLFNIPGMGRLAYQSVTSHDWPVLFNIIFLTGIITIIGQIILDVIYAMLDPRIKLST